MYTVSDFWTFLRVRYFLFQQARAVRKKFPDFSIYDQQFKKAYRFCNPYKICQKGEIASEYGETPLTVYATIAKLCELSSQDHILELGCGRGIGVFFLSHLLRCPVTGVDWIPLFIDKAHQMARGTQLPIHFHCENMFQTDLHAASVIYLYGTCLSDDSIQILIERFKQLNPFVKIITVSYPLSDYSSCFIITKQFSGEFPWGTGDIYLNKLK